MTSKAALMWENEATTERPQKVLRTPPGPSRSQPKELIDLSDILAPRPTSVYRYYDPAGILLYVGITSRGTARNREHNATKDWWPFVTRQEVEHYPTRDEAAHREVALIRAHRPPFNRQHNPDGGSLREAYLTLAATGAQFPPHSAWRLFHETAKRLPLRVLSGGDSRHMDLASLPEHGPLVEMVDWSDPTLLLAPRKVGRVTSIRRLDQVAVIAITGKLIPDGVVEVRARLKCTSQKPLRIQVAALEVITQGGVN